MKNINPVIEKKTDETETPMRTSSVDRKTNETDISIRLNIDGTGKAYADTGVGFFDHMLKSLGKHGRFDMSVKCKGDIYVDFHHTVEDVGIALGEAYKECLGNKIGIKRYGVAFTPMDEAMAEVAVTVSDLNYSEDNIQAIIDASGRPFLVFNAEFALPMVGEFPTELVEEFFRAFAMHSMTALHINVPYGKNTHHIIEAIFKSVGRALCEAATIDNKTLMSTKGVL